jgi:hypothetical protein
MSQVSDVSLANQGFSAFRTELNNILGALNSMHSGTSRPGSATTGTMWLDTTNSGSNSLEIKFFDGSDDISVATIDTSANTINFLDSVVTGINIVTDTSPQLGGDLDTNSFNIQIDDAHGLFDENNNEQLVFQTTVTGSDTNVGLDVSTKGNGKIKFNDLAYFPEVTITSSSNAVAWDSQAAPNAKHTTTENTTFSAPSNATTGSFIALNIQYGGSHTIAWNTVFEFAASTAPTATSTSGKSDQLVFRYNGTVWQEVGRSLNMSAT